MDVDIAEIAFYFTIVAFVFWETISPRRVLLQPTWLRWFNHFLLFLLNSFIYRWLAVGAFVVSDWYLAVQPWGLLNWLPLDDISLFIIGFLALDFWAYIKHRLFHAVPMLWRLHRVHHSDLDIDVFTSFRAHPAAMLVDNGLSIAFYYLLGTSPELILTYIAVVSCYDLFTHANIKIPAPIESLLSRLLITPDKHRVHHSIDYKEGNSNYSTIFVCWDKLFNTYTPEPALGVDAEVVGVKGFNGATEVWLPAMLSQPFRAASSSPVSTAKPQTTDTP
ncbi:sterol desaturase family protein [Dasania sp. GY-MA-18]|uniref:Sterol desaturase family protein n=1 Tax=Dasania phycosphaerae TaxID=2950436 RepID=A0A9J6RNF9_9GAMM|nr:MULTISPECIES: sterol desaturase family protein [Dasania]MCR8923602.1 sterol desaturase family protein [Dasania sp. GY-MA-18]MCZ0866036.1 sterol desaturase family protein [Dasania phycosphaerae]MCZ0869760.1 sterol desaturase family protein [Dasania phycosphaerae]